MPAQLALEVISLRYHNAQFFKVAPQTVSNGLAGLAPREERAYANLAKGAGQLAPRLNVDTPPDPEDKFDFLKRCTKAVGEVYIKPGLFHCLSLAGLGDINSFIVNADYFIGMHLLWSAFDATKPRTDLEARTMITQGIAQFETALHRTPVDERLRLREVGITHLRSCEEALEKDPRGFELIKHQLGFLEARYNLQSELETSLVIRGSNFAGELHRRSYTYLVSHGATTDHTTFFRT